MPTITMLGMKGRTGRTKVTMALIVKGRRVLIVNGTEDGTFEVCETLREWQDLLQEDRL